jgi:hypothetical protein
VVPVAYEVPDSVTVAPTGPDDGVSVSVGVVTVNSVAATIVLVEGSSTTTHGSLALASAIVVPDGIDPVVEEKVAAPLEHDVVAVATKQNS